MVVIKVVMSQYDWRSKLYLNDFIDCICLQTSANNLPDPLCPLAAAIWLSHAGLWAPKDSHHRPKWKLADFKYFLSFNHTKGMIGWDGSFWGIGSITTTNQERFFKSRYCEKHYEAHVKSGRCRPLKGWSEKKMAWPEHMFFSAQHV